MKSICVRILCCAALAVGLISCVDVPSYPVHGGGYYGGGGGGYGYNGYNQGYNQGYYAGNRNSNNNNRHEQHHEVHCYCSHKSCGCKPGHPKGGCYCDKGEHRH